MENFNLEKLKKEILETDDQLKDIFLKIRERTRPIFITEEYFNEPLAGICPNYPSCDSKIVYWFYNMSKYPGNEMLVHCDTCGSTFLATTDVVIHVEKSKNKKLKSVRIER